METIKDDAVVSVTISREQYETLQRLEAQEQKRLEAERRKGDRDAYRKLSGEVVDNVFSRLVSCSEELSRLKAEVYASFEELQKTKMEIMGGREAQISHTYMSTDGTKRIRLGYHLKDSWDDTVEQGIDKVKNWITGQTTDEKSKELVTIILDLLSKDSQGNLKADKVMLLGKHAQSIGDEEFLEGVRIIEEAYRPTKTKQYVRAEMKDAQGKWQNIPLGITEAK